LNGVRRGDKYEESFLFLQSSLIMHFSDSERARSIYILINPLQRLVFLHDTVILYIMQ